MKHNHKPGDTVHVVQFKRGPNGEPRPFARAAVVRRVVVNDILVRWADSQTETAHVDASKVFASADEAMAYEVLGRLNVARGHAAQAKAAMEAAVKQSAAADEVVASLEGEYRALTSKAPEVVIAPRDSFVTA